jgi:hypothetical protein
LPPDSTRSSGVPELPEPGPCPSSDVQPLRRIGAMTDDQEQIRTLIERWAAAVRRGTQVD